MWSGNHIGHGTEIGNHTYLASHVVLSGHCKIGERCFIGVNATFRDFITIGEDCFIAMDASVSRDLPSGSVALGSPAKILLSEDRRANVIKKKYFKL
jgi:acetyltransferase-like isoleucine patch superfamily enzyme